LSWISLDPFLLDVLVILLGPQHTRQSLPHDVLQIVTDTVPGNAAIEFVGVDSSFLDVIIEKLLIQDRRVFLGSSGSHLQSDDDTSSFSWYTLEFVVSSSLCTGLVGVNEMSTSRLGGRSWWWFDSVGGSGIGILSILRLNAVTVGSGFLFRNGMLG